MNAHNFSEVMTLMNLLIFYHSSLKQTLHQLSSSAKMTAYQALGNSTRKRLRSFVRRLTLQLASIKRNPFLARQLSLLVFALSSQNIKRHF